MFFRDTIDLITVTYSTNDYGDLLGSEVTTTVFADKQGIRQSEFYQAFQTGLKPELMFVIRAIDYNNQPKLSYNNKQYDIIRTYNKDGEMLELVCSSIVGTEVRT